jgi:hypothetical protein
MKKLLNIIVVILFLASCQGTDSDNPLGQTPEQVLAAKKLEITSYISTFSCANSNGCGFIAFGEKPCGGPREYLIFPNSVNLTLLQTMVAEYNELDKQNNIKKNLVSDCMFMQPPTNIGCVNGICTVIN